MVTRTLQTGPWPSPYKSLQDANDSITMNVPRVVTSTVPQHYTHMSAVCASLEKFTNDIIIPSLLSEFHNALVPVTGSDASLVGVSMGNNIRRRSSKTNTPSTFRAFFGTLLILREILI